MASSLIYLIHRVSMAKNTSEELLDGKRERTDTSKVKFTDKKLMVKVGLELGTFSTTQTRR